MERLSNATLARLGKNRARPPTVALPNASRVRAPLRVDVDVAQRKLLIPTGKRYVKKDGSLGAEQKIPFILVTATASIMRRQREVFNFSVTNRATRVLDSRDGKRKSISAVRAELLRICNDDSAADTLQNFIAE